MKYHGNGPNKNTASKTTFHERARFYQHAPCQHGEEGILAEAANMVALCHGQHAYSSSRRGPETRVIKRLSHKKYTT